MLTALNGDKLPSQNLAILQIINKPAIIEKVEPPAMTVGDKIKTNFYKCDTNTQWIRADNAECLAKSTTDVQKPVREAQNTSNGYPVYQCTWYAKSRRPDLPNNLGNADTWVRNAATQGFRTGTTPIAGAIGQQGMHVVYVEDVNNDGTILISERNYDYNGSFRYRTASASSFTYIY